jgi:Nickel responsive protein SCO4226-like
VAAFLIERYWPGVTEGDVGRLNVRLTEASDADVTFVGSYLVPGDEMVIFEFLGPDAEAVVDMSRRTGLRCDRIVAVTHLRRGGPEPGTELGP